jgi:integrase
LIALANFAPDWPPSAETVEAFLDSYDPKKYSGVTLAEYWGRLNTWFEWTIEQGYLDWNPMRRVTRRGMPKVEAGVIRPEDFVKVIKAIEQAANQSKPRQQGLPHERAIRDLALIRFTYATGCRRGEVAGLRLRDLYLEEQRATIYYKTSKSKHSRTVYFGRQAKRSLAAWLQIRPEGSEQVFLGTRGNGWSNVPFTPAGVYEAWQGWQQKVKIGPYRFHEIRHSHITHSLDNGIPVHHVSGQAGHSSPDITLRIYAHSQDPERQRAYNGKNPDDTLTEE